MKDLARDLELDDCVHFHGVVPFFEARIVFPYWSRGHVVFMIGRRTPWTPDVDWEKSKYKKLGVRNGRNNEHVAPCIRNDVLYNEDVFLTCPERVIITELKNSTYFARLVLQQQNEVARKIVEIDARPSDAIALALRVNAPIFVTEKVVSQAKNVEISEEKEETDKWREWLENLKPEDFGKYRM